MKNAWYKREHVAIVQIESIPEVDKSALTRILAIADVQNSSDLRESSREHAEA